MRPITWITALAWLTVSIGCERTFEEPPETVTLEAFQPAGAFSDSQVTLCGTNLAKEPTDNQVFFDLTQAEVVGFEDPTDERFNDLTDLGCDQLLTVEVPVLPDGIEETGASILLENPTGRATAETPFDYRGPGHPVKEQIQKELHLRAGLRSVFTPPGLPLYTYGAVSQEANMVSLFDTQLGLHLDFGQCALPLSAAAAVTEVELVGDLKLVFTIVGINMEFLPPADKSQPPEIELSMWSWTFDLLQLADEYRLAAPEPVYMPSDSDRQPFEPAQVWSYLQPGQSLLHDLVVSHASKPAIAVFPIDDLDNATVIELPDQAPYCAVDPDERLGPIADLVWEPETQVFYVALAKNNEIWRISPNGSIVQRVFPPEDMDNYDGEIDCSWRNFSIALRQSHPTHDKMRLYVASWGLPQVRPMQPFDTPGGEELRPVAGQLISLDGFPYAMTAGRYNFGGGVTGERLYVATQNGLVLIDVTEYSPILLPNVQLFRRMGEIPVPLNTGTPQSLVTSATFNALLGQGDTIAFADANNDKVLLYTAGLEALLLADVTLGATLPILTSSYRGDRLFFTDVLSNSIQVVDRDSGLRLGGFPIAPLTDHDFMGFGSLGMANLRGQDYDLLILPLLDLTLDEDGDGVTEPVNAFRYEKISFGRFSDELPECGLSTSGMSVETADIGEFHLMQLVSWEWEGRSAVPVLVFNRRREVSQLIDENGEPTGDQLIYEPRTWCLEVDPDAPPDSLLAGTGPLCDLGVDPDGPVEVLGIRPAQRSPAIARLEQWNEPNQEPTYKLHLFVLDKGTFLAETGLIADVNPQLAPYITDIQVLEDRSQQEPVYVVHMAMHALGRVLEVSFDLATDGIVQREIETGGTPNLLFTSPDGKRTYITHLYANRVDILELACEPETGCATLASTLDVGADPFLVEFADSGRYAYVIHLFSNDVTVIE